MRIDLYSKVMLTVIALCLVWLALGRTPTISVMPQVSAQSPRVSGYQRVVIAGWVDGDGFEHGLAPGSRGATNALPVNVDTK